MTLFAKVAYAILFPHPECHRPLPGTRILASLSRVWQRKLAMPVKGGNYWLGPLFLISQAVELLELWWGGAGQGRERLVALFHQSLKCTFSGAGRPLPLKTATEARWLEGSVEPWVPVMALVQCS